MSVPICAECAHLVGVRSRTDLAKEWKCGQSPASKDSVTGSTIYQQTCYEARTPSGVCGMEARLYKLYERLAELPSTARRSSSPSAEALLGELGL